MSGPSQTAAVRRNYRAGAAVAIITSFLTIWATIVRDDGNGYGFFMLIMAAVVGGFAASFRPAGMARAMVGVAIMQVLLVVAIATAPITASVPGAPTRFLLFGGVFMLSWLTSAAFFFAAAKTDRTATASGVADA